MGSGSSTPEDKFQKSLNTIDNLEGNVKELSELIIERGNSLIQEITDRGYVDLELCDRLQYQKVDELKTFFPIRVLDNVRYRLGVKPDKNLEALNEDKEQICQYIISFYRFKIRIIHEIKNELNNCVELEQEVKNRLSAETRELNMSDPRWVEVYKKLEKFNKDILFKYTQINNNIQRIMDTKNMEELQRISKSANISLGNTTSMCKNYANDLSILITNLPTPII